MNGDVPGSEVDHFGPIRQPGPSPGTGHCWRCRRWCSRAWPRALRRSPLGRWPTRRRRSWRPTGRRAASHCPLNRHRTLEATHRRAPTSPKRAGSYSSLLSPFCCSSLPNRRGAPSQHWNRKRKKTDEYFGEAFKKGGDWCKRAAATLLAVKRPFLIEFRPLNP